VLCSKKTVVDRKSHENDEKELIQNKKGSKGKTQELKKKSHRGHGCLCCVRCMDDSMKHKVTCRTKRTSTVQMDQRGKPRN
jgi:hypothetical protein